MALEITRKTPIGELVMNYPSAVEILFNYGFHCIGCGLSDYETIEEGAASHGFDDEAIGRLVEELNAAAKKAPLPAGPEQKGVDSSKKLSAAKKAGSAAKTKEKKPKSKGK